MGEQSKCWVYMCDGAATHRAWLYESSHPSARPAEITVCQHHAGKVFNRRLYQQSATDLGLLMREESSWVKP